MSSNDPADTRRWANAVLMLPQQRSLRRMLNVLDVVSIKSKYYLSFHQNDSHALSFDYLCG